MRMKLPLHILLSILLAVPLLARSEEVPPPPGQFRQMPRMQMQHMAPEQREQMREERRQRREAWQQMSPEERHQLRRDIRDAGQTLYPHGRQRRPE